MTATGRLSFNSLYKITPATFDCWMRILRRVGLPELITGSLAQYEDLAVELAAKAAKPDKLAALGARLHANRLTQPPQAPGGRVA